MTWRRAREALCGLGVGVGAALVIGCGGSGDTTTVIVREKPPPRASSKPAEPAPPPRPSLATRAERLVTAYYSAVSLGDYQRAWSLLSPGLQGEQGGFFAWRDGYGSTISTTVSGVQAIQTTPPSVIVALDLAATDLDACGNTVDQTFAGTWTLEQSPGQLLATDFDVEKISGATPVRDAAACGSSEPAPLASPSCDPNYTGCVPHYPPDVDCADVSESVEVIGEDVHSLDLGGDGHACELY